MTEFFLGDSLEILPSFTTNSVDLVVTSPPYDNLRTYNDSLEWNFDVFKGIANELTRLMRPGGVIVWNVNDSVDKGSETGTSFRQALYFKDVCGLNIHDTMIWKKPNFANPSSNRYHQLFEYMFVFSKGKPKVFNPIKDKKNKYTKPFGRNTRRLATGEMVEVPIKPCGEYGMRGNVWEMNTTGQENIGKAVFHPATFPIQLAQDHILSWTNAGDTVLDPFAGSGTVALAALRTGRKSINIEKDVSYYNYSLQRLEEEKQKTPKE